MKSIKFHQLFLFFLPFLFFFNSNAQNCRIDIEGATTFCVGESSDYKGIISSGIDSYEWTIDGEQQGTAPDITINWSEVGTITLCLEALEVCDNGFPKHCISIEVTEIAPTEVAPVLCAGQAFIIGDRRLTTSGIYQNTFPSYQGCDSLVIYDLTIKEPKTHFIQEIGCSGIEYVLGDTTYTTTGIHTYTFTAADGCDSIVTLDLFVELPVQIALPDTSICAEGFIALGDSLFTKSGYHYVYFKTVEQCDSIVGFRLNVRPPIASFRSDIICAEDAPFEIGDQLISETGVFDYIFPAADGCDSTVTVDLTIREPIFSIRYDTICADDCLPIRDTCFAQTGRHTYIFESVAGCDSTVTINLLVKQPKESYQRVDVCAGDTLAAGLNLWTRTGIYEYKIKASDGCDSIITYDLGVKAPNQTFLDEVICFGECFDFHPNVICQTGFYTVTYLAGDQCDSVVFLNLIVLDDLTHEFEQSLCEGECVAIGDSLVCETGHYEIVLEGSEGCDSLVIADIFANKELVYEFRETICVGDCYDKIQDTIICDPGIHQVLLQSVDGCDSLVILELILEEDIGLTKEIIEVCVGECIEVSNSRLCVGGLYNFVYSSQNGCDSTVIVELVLKDTVHTSFAETICNGDSIKVGSLHFFDAGEYMEVVSNEAGCDSFINFTINLLECTIETLVTIDSTGCNGLDDGKIVLAVTEGIPPFTYEWKSPYIETDSMGTIDSLNQKVVFDNLEAGTYSITVSDTLSNMEIVHLEVFQPVDFDHEWDVSDYSGFNVSCEGERDAFLEILPTGGTMPYTYKWSNGGITSGLSGLAAETYSVTVTDAIGCTFRSAYEVKAPSILHGEVEINNPTCDSVATGGINVMSIEGGAAPYTFDLSNQGFSERQSYKALKPGSYNLTIKDANGCSIDFSAELPIPAVPELNFDKNVYIDLGDEFPVDLLSTVPLVAAEWEGVEGLSCYACLDPIASPHETTTYTVSAISVDNCESTKELVVHVDKKRDVFVPNVFSPNGDGINDRLIIHGGPEVSNIIYFKVYSRWGALVYDGAFLKPNEVAHTWDGSFDGQPLRSGSFIWMAQISFIDGVVLEYTGDVVIK